MQVLELPQSSVATHVRVIVCASGQFPPVVTSENVTVGVASQLSAAVAIPVAAGAVLSSQSIVANQVRVMTDSCGLVPPKAISLNVMVGVGSQLSVAVANSVLAGGVLA